jgi:hypothetical protein
MSSFFQQQSVSHSGAACIRLARVVLRSSENAEYSRGRRHNDSAPLQVTLSLGRRGEASGTVLRARVRYSDEAGSHIDVTQVDAKIAFGKFASVDKMVAESSWCVSQQQEICRTGAAINTTKRQHDNDVVELSS